MAKGAANEAALGALHSKLAAVFTKVLERYEARMQAADTIDVSSMESEVLEELFAQNVEPNPAMLAAVAKFLKDNEVRFDTEELNKLSDTERRLQERREKRQNVVALRDVPRVRMNE